MRIWLHIIILSLVAGMSLSALANCPSIDKVKFKCISVVGQKHCQWSAPWYEGFPDTHAIADETPTAFIRVFWSTAIGVPELW